MDTVSRRASTKLIGVFFVFIASNKGAATLLTVNSFFILCFKGGGEQVPLRTPLLSGTADTLLCIYFAFSNYCLL
jgi:hypothetical protein